MLTERHPTTRHHHEAPASLLGIETSERTMSPAAIKSPCNANRDQRTRESWASAGPGSWATRTHIITVRRITSGELSKKAEGIVHPPRLTDRSSQAQANLL